MSDSGTRLLLLLGAVGSALKARNNADNRLHSAQATHLSPLRGWSGPMYTANTIAAVKSRQEQDGRIQYPG